MITTMTEKQLTKKFREKIPPRFDVQTFESCENKSVPDLYIVRRGWGQSFWVEAKIQKHGKVEFQHGQVQWIEHHLSIGGYCFVLLENNGMIELYKGDDARWLSTVKNLESWPNRAMFSVSVKDSQVWILLAAKLDTLLR